MVPGAVEGFGDRSSCWPNECPICKGSSRICEKVNVEDQVQTAAGGSMPCLITPVSLSSTFRIVRTVHRGEALFFS